jgi:hypothetical protein
VLFIDISEFLEREEAARCLITIHEGRGQVIDFLRSVISMEVNAASDCQTLFRANSMASKAIDVYMKQVALNYLQTVLSSLIQRIVSEGKPCEVILNHLVSE